MKPRTLLTGIILSSLIVVLVSPFIGMEWIGPQEIWPGSEGKNTLIFWEIRVPRVLLAFLAGASLSLAGLAFQTLFRNSLATPFTLGISSGAALSAAISIQLGLGTIVLGSIAIPGSTITAFVGAILTLLLVYLLAQSRKRVTTGTLLLAGVAINYFFSSLILFVQYTSDFYNSFRILRWLMGGLEGTQGYSALVQVFVPVIIGSGIIFPLWTELNLLTTGEELAASRGVDVRRVRKRIFFATSILVGGVVAVCGPIGFVGLMSPHICRLLLGFDHRRLLVASFFFGGGFLVACDTFARTILAPTELPVGILTAFLGGPFFLFLLLKKRSF